MPSYNSDGKPNISDMFYYCCTHEGGSRCPVFNIMEANKYSWRTNSQACDAPEIPGIYPIDSCDNDHSREKLCTLDQFDLYPSTYGFGSNPINGPDGPGGIDT